VPVLGYELREGVLVACLGCGERAHRSTFA
jgi:hypothetical protein